MTINKDAIYADVLRRIREDIGDPADIVGGCCLPFTTHGAVAIYEATGLDPMLQAGSAHFRYIPRELDDGKIATTFSYQWEPNHPLSVQRIAAGQLPEIHCWLAIRETREIIDFSTAYIAREAARCGLHWRAAKLPPYIWSKELPDGVCYFPELAACRFITRFIQEKLLLCQNQKQSRPPINKSLTYGAARS